MSVNDTEAEFFLSVYLVQAIRALDLIYKSNKDDYLDIRFKLLKIRVDNPLNSHQNETFKRNATDCFSFLQTTSDHFTSLFENDGMETFDHGMLFTRSHDFGFHNSLLGCSFLSGICDKKYKYSTLNLQHFSVLDFVTLAHDVGHNLGMRHTEKGKMSTTTKNILFFIINSMSSYR
jgi:hypothetical protein